MAPLLSSSKWNERTNSNQVSPIGKVFFVCEGENTESWYFDALFTQKNRAGVPRTLDLQLITRTGQDKGKSDPKCLREFARQITEEGECGFDAKTDSVVIVFDVDVFLARNDDLTQFIDSLPSNVKACITNPNIELFLILHAKDAYRQHILKHEADLLENKKEHNRRYSDKLVSEIFGGFNPKTNKRKIIDLTDKFDNALREEQFINGDYKLAMDRLTCNIARTLNEYFQK